MNCFKMKRAAAGGLFLLCAVFSSSRAAEAPHPLLAAVCRNDYTATAALSPEQLDLDKIYRRGDARRMRALDLAVANGYWEITTLLMYAGAVVSNNTLSVACDRKQAKKICAQNPRWQHHRTCRTAEMPDRWVKTCNAPDRYCRKILKP